MRIDVKPQLQLENDYYYVEIIEAEPYRGNWGPCISVMFRLLATKHAGAKIRLVVPAMATGKNKTGRLLMAAGVNLTVKDELDSNQLLGKKVIIRTKLIEGNSGWYSKVENVLPADDPEAKPEMIIRP